MCYLYDDNNNKKLNLTNICNDNNYDILNIFVPNKNYYVINGKIIIKPYILNDKYVLRYIYNDAVLNETRQNFNEETINICE